MDEDEMTYRSAFARLQDIVAEIESGEVDVDALTASVKEATQLVAFCRARLTATQREIAQALKDVEAAAQPAVVASDMAPTPGAPEPAPVASEEDALQAATRETQRPAVPSGAARRSAPADTDSDGFDPFASI